MSLFGGRAHEDREHLVQTLRSLGPTSLGGLSAALSWTPRRTERAARAALAWGEGAIEYDPRSGRIAFRAPLATRATASPAVAPTAPTPRAPPPPLPKAWNAAPKCPACSVPFVATGTGTGVYCPNCGRLALRSGAASAVTPAEPERTPTAPPAATTSHGPATTLGADRHSQELFAAWVTSRPIPCPKCRTALRHKGVGRYACPACGAQVAFADEPRAIASAGAGPTAAPPLPHAPAAPTGPSARAPDPA